MRDSNGYPDLGKPHGVQVTDPTPEQVEYATISLIVFIGVILVILLALIFVPQTQGGING